MSRTLPALQPGQTLRRIGLVGARKGCGPHVLHRLVLDFNAEAAGKRADEIVADVRRRRLPRCRC